ncbi:MAG TPA: AlkA N-terminal domain-containing protein [Solirubrobacterales bacterium]|nr:AlkA N-terminal domain-containing protein [Solirubrobacterales bacterium]
MIAELRPRPPFEPAALIGFLGRRAVPGIEERADDGAYRRSLRLAGGPATVELRPGDGVVQARFELARTADRPEAEAAARALLDLDADPGAIVAALGDDELLGPLVRANPGLRLPGHPDPAELAARAVIGQQVSVSAARTIAGRLVAAHGEPLARPLGGVTHLVPTPAALARLGDDALPMPRSRARALAGLAGALAAGELVLDRADPAAARAGMLALPGIGPWTATYVEMRALGNRDAFLATDLGVRRALEGLGLDGSPRAAEELAERWRPYRAYALQHLWTTLD